MRQFDDNIPHRNFDNFQFVNFTSIMSKHMDTEKKEAAFALAALMEIPIQYRLAQSFQSTEGKKGPRARPLPPPREVIAHDQVANLFPRAPSSEPADPVAAAEQVCPICLTNPKDMAFGCGHLTCRECGASISLCPLCREPIKTRIRLYG
ncbi:unnamed protein product [Cuscuta campestris]|uniref:RING-type domain-containing protein n=1 Tax=Cuscuta campestris TaxID=132261 RepID=A0A484KF74_9ASTE|nr:unnamed protein product [Cuscuta campestris]